VENTSRSSEKTRNASTRKLWNEVKMVAKKKQKSQLLKVTQRKKKEHEEEKQQQNLTFVFFHSHLGVSHLGVVLV